MKNYLKYILTAVIVAIALILVLVKYRDYATNPWTRDGQVRANVIQITPRVSGPIVNLPIRDNQFVKAGDLLFEIDPRTFEATLEQARAKLAQTGGNVEAQEKQVEAARAREPGAGLLPDPNFQVAVMNLAVPEFSASMPASMAPAFTASQRFPLAGKLSLQSDLARQATEIAHFGSAHALGLRRHLRQPMWKSEGWAEYQANLAAIRSDPDYDLRRRIDVLQDESYWAGRHGVARSLWESQLLVEFLGEVQKYRLTDLVREDVTKESTRGQMMSWYHENP